MLEQYKDMATRRFYCRYPENPEWTRSKDTICMSIGFTYDVT